MGESKTSLNTICRTVSLRYRFIYENVGGGEPELQFLPHPLIELEVEQPEPAEQGEPELKPEDVEYVDDVEYLRSLDPKEWKSQDHYKVLGIETLRHKATEDIIKTAYRKKVLKHHPDKRKALGEEIKADDDYFTNITMAYETLGTVQKRRAFDSVDPEFDNNIPSGSELKKDFFEVFNYYFDLNARWSEKPKVPKLGNINSSREEVEKFYSFWYDFKSWREYSYEDEEDKDKCQDRDERRYVDKLNKAERLRKKKEEMSRIRSLVDLAYNNDPRIAKFKQEDKDRKLAAKRAKQTAAQQKKDEEERILREVQLAKEQAEAAERARIEAKRQEREAVKKALKKERKILRDMCKANNYYTDNSEQNLKHITTIEAICETLSIEELEQLNKNIKNNGKSGFLKAINDHEKKIEKERQEVLNAAKQKTTEEKNTAIIKVAPEWNEENLQLLVKSVNLFPAGTNQRWEVIANFINQHGLFTKDSGKFTAKLVLAKAKDLQNTDFSKNNLKEQANKKAFDTFKKDKKQVLNVDETGISKKLDEVTLNGKLTNGIRKTASKSELKQEQPNVEKETKEDTNKAEKFVKFDVLPWTSSEQQLLEQALKTYPASTPERWDRIAECIPNRSKKECMKRYKELVETVKAKKAAQAAVGTTAK
ncbi:dnaJ homolog subfamily C member 2 [Anthonomus grandis grandis]|uniref:dnaJ homolog subfamily C member 2 n=1 Tax=Anthonomus grandis grandis TaxID=2921223 RepID=UPI002165DFD3|nr:dnaJ homolog subfamily C member 2 [Anthonomus grandis grandis]